MKRVFTFISCLLLIYFSNAQTPNVEWAISFGGAGEDKGNRVVVYANGNVFTVGVFEGTVDFDPGPNVFGLTSSGNSYDIYISKFNADGSFKWAKRMGGTTFDEGYSIALDKSGNIYATGYFRETADFDPGVGIFNLISKGETDIFISKLDPSGDFVWAKQMGGVKHDNGYSIAIDDSFNILLTGRFFGTTDFDPGAGVFNLTSTGFEDIFISKLDSAGNLLWAKKFGDYIWDQGLALVLDDFRNVYITGYFQGAVDFDPDSSTYELQANAGADAFILKLDTRGKFVWAKQLWGNAGSLGQSISLDRRGNVYTTGYFNGFVDFDPGVDSFNLTTRGDEEIFISKLDASGNFLWAKSIGAKSKERAYSIAVDNLGYVYLTGDFLDSVDFDPGQGVFVLKAENFDIFILKLSSDGDFIWAKSMGSESSDQGKSICVDSRGNVYTTGFFSDTLYIRNGDSAIILNNDSRPWNDAFISKINQDSCAYMSLVIDSISDLSCLSKGYISTHALDGLPHYAYAWSTTPPKKDSFVDISSVGIYSLTVTDANKCWRSTSLLINGPIANAGFDLNSNLSASIVRPGRSTTLKSLVINDRCTQVSGQLLIVLDSLVKFDKSAPTPDIIKGDTLIWNFSNLSYDSKPLKPEIYVTTSTKATTGDTVCFDVIITPIIGDSNTKNNIKRYCYPINNSYDPNIKSVYPAGACKENYALKNEVLTYTVQFQNTGNAEAIDIFILDSLDADLDINTLRVVGQSHQPMITEVLPGGVLKFDFRNINLPDSGTNEIGSNGYVIYEVMPKSGLPSGTKVTGNADIYFDFNPPVMTNTVMNTLVSTIPSCNVGIESLPEKLPTIKVYPNPTPGHLTVDLKQSGTVTIYDMVGNLIYEKTCSSGQNTLDISTLANGIYLLKANGAGVRLVKVQ